MRKKLSIEDEKYIIENYNNFSTKDLMLKFNVSKTPILRLLKKNNVVIKTSKIYDADGYVRHGELRLKLKRGDKKHIELFRDCLGSNHKIIDEIGKVVVSGRTYTSEYSSLSIYNTKLVKDLIKHGCTNKKTFTITFPELREDLIRHFIRGYFDGDGSIYQNKTKNLKSFNVVSASLTFINSIINVFEKLDITICISDVENLYRIYVSNYDGINKIYDYMYNKKCYCLNRKRIIFEKIISKI